MSHLNSNIDLIAISRVKVWTTFGQCREKTRHSSTACSSWMKEKKKKTNTYCLALAWLIWSIAFKIDSNKTMIDMTLQDVTCVKNDGSIRILFFFSRSLALSLCWFPFDVKLRCLYTDDISHHFRPMINRTNFHFLFFSLSKTTDINNRERQNCWADFHSLIFFSLSGTKRKQIIARTNQEIGTWPR